jgi:hypothetical protein
MTRARELAAGLLCVVVATSPHGRIVVQASHPSTSAFAVPRAQAAEVRALSRTTALTECNEHGLCGRAD